MTASRLTAEIEVQRKSKKAAEARESLLKLLRVLERTPYEKKTEFMILARRQVAWKLERMILLDQEKKRLLDLEDSLHKRYSEEVIERAFLLIDKEQKMVISQKDYSDNQYPS